MDHGKSVAGGENRKREEIGELTTSSTHGQTKTDTHLYLGVQND